MSAIRTSISLTEYEVKIIQDLSKRTGIKNISAAVRYIINEWAHDHEKPLPAQPGDPLHTTPE